MAREIPLGFEMDAGEGVVGADPRKLAVADLNALGHEKAAIMSVIRAKCLDCCNDSPAEVRRCTAIACSLWPYRMNHNPFASREMSDEQRAAAVERLAKARQARAV